MIRCNLATMFNISCNDVYIAGVTAASIIVDAVLQFELRNRVGAKFAADSLAADELGELSDELGVTVEAREQPLISIVAVLAPSPPPSARIVQPLAPPPGPPQATPPTLPPSAPLGSAIDFARASSLNSPATSSGAIVYAMVALGK